MNLAAELSGRAAEDAIHEIARATIDGFPLTDDFAPSFHAALDAVQRAESRQ